MASIIIGGEEFTLPKLTFKRIKKVWPIVKKLEAMDFLNEQDVDKVMNMMDDVIKVVAIALNTPGKDADWIEENLTMPEMMSLQNVFTDLLIDSGLAERTPEGAKVGEETPPATEEHPSMATGIDTSQT